ncbi:acyltransferase family protein [Salinibacterium sp. G-O1]|uniref:acyltransferase family protein n=1 Tax=Salinibacterium sp. G-O1 TaxID=3046208 RepID=UPI0024B8A183|nr:acyltransferase family protein [Salinibacterium sp. G-O1]MDJ0336529.1 acyltransferase family protein [Salinibacterium sp. G-O1]
MRVKSTSAGTTPRSGNYRRDIQYLRALAVGVVVLYHFWPNVVPAGFIGVDVFFVISGFLITSHLLDTLATRGRISLATFWGNRVRRLLPASLLVLGVSIILAAIWVPPAIREQAYREIGASALYIQNWVLASDSIDYLGASNEPSLVQHFWSLSVEEQFYAAWPLILIAAIFIATRFARKAMSPRNATITVSIALGIVAVASFATSIVMTYTNPSVAYFATTTRAWEFALGGLLSSVPIVAAGPRGRFQRRTARIVAAAAGLAAVVASTFLLSSESPFPGWIAVIPVMGAVVIIWAGIGTETTPSDRPNLLEQVGNSSYSIYLWHWPLLIVAPFALGYALSFSNKVVLLLVIAVLSWLSTTFVENPIRRNRWLRHRAWRPFIAAAVVTAMVLAGAAAGNQVLTNSTSPASLYSSEQIDAGISCFGAAALDPSASCGSPFDASRVDTAFSRNDRLADCIAAPSATVAPCEGGEVENYTHTLAFVGDSHAASMGELVEASLPDEWRVVTYFAVGCPGISRQPVQAPGQSPDKVKDCARWSAEVLDDIESRDDIDAVLFTNYTDKYADPTLDDAIRLSTATVTSTWATLEQTGKMILALRDVPLTSAGDIPTCLDSSAQTDDPCSTPRDAAITTPNVLAESAQSSGAAFLDLTDHFCDATTCHAVVGDVSVYSDDSHVTRTYARTLVPYLTPKLADALG